MPLSPDRTPDLLELIHTESTALITRLRAWYGKRRDDGLPVRLVDFGGVKVLVEQDHQYGVEFPFDVDRPEPLSWLAAGQHAAAVPATGPIRGSLVLNWRQKAQARAQVRLAIEDTLDEGLPRAYTPEVFKSKCVVLFEHVFETFGDTATA